MNNWKTLSKERVLERNKFLKIEDHKIQLPNGKIIDDWPWVITPDFVNIVAVTTDHNFICLRQTKYAVQEISLAPIGGYIEPGENPLIAAQRELLEETGYSTTEWIDLGSYVVDANRGCGRAFIFLAKNAVKVSEPTEIDAEQPELIFLSREEVLKAIERGDFKVLSYALSFSLALSKI